MYYQKVIFDFDSTLIRFESLDKILVSGISKKANKEKKIQLITQRAMNGEIPFEEALSERLSISKPRKQNNKQCLGRSQK